MIYGLSYFLSMPQSGLPVISKGVSSNLNYCTKTFIQLYDDDPIKDDLTLLS